MEDLEEIGSPILLCNTYHLFLRPGVELLEEMGGLHKFISWDRTILTDSGGFQVFSLGANVKISEDGAAFRSHIDGKKIFFSPENVAETQLSYGVDIQMVLDICAHAEKSEKQHLEYMNTTTRWAKRARKTFLESPKKKEKDMQFGILQGGLFKNLRKAHLEDLMEIGFEGLSIGGLSVGESTSQMYECLDFLSEILPADVPRYLMGVGTPADIAYAVMCGVDMFDCVLPSRNARNGYAFTWNGPVHIKNARFKDDQSPLEENCQCLTCKRYSKAYLRHLYISKELSVHRFMTYHNQYFYYNLIQTIKSHIKNSQLPKLVTQLRAAYPGR